MPRDHSDCCLTVHFMESVQMFSFLACDSARLWQNVLNQCTVNNLTSSAPFLLCRRSFCSLSCSDFTSIVYLIRINNFLASKKIKHSWQVATCRAWNKCQRKYYCFEKARTLQRNLNATKNFKQMKQRRHLICSLIYHRNGFEIGKVAGKRNLNIHLMKPGWNTQCRGV